MSTSSVTRVCAVGDFTSKLAVSYLDYVALCHSEESTDGGGLKNSEEPLRQTFKSVDLHLSSNQLTQLMEAVSERRAGPQSTVEEKNLVTISWGEFCVCCAEVHSLLTQQQTCKPIIQPEVEKPSSRRWCGSCKCEVFLGGSCNPTTWRRDATIPALHEAGITYFNPQVDEWYPELIEVEEQAKQSASILFFVVDNQTRAVSSMIEIAYLAGLGRDLVVVVEDVNKEGSKVGEDLLSQREAEDLNRGRAFVRSLLEEGGSYLSGSVEEGTKAVVSVMKQGNSISEHSAKSRPLRVSPRTPLGESLRLLTQVFTMYDHDRKGHLTLIEAEIALRSLHIDVPVLFSLLGSKRINRSHDQSIESHDQTVNSCDLSHDLLSQYQQNGLSFDDFCTLYSELKYRVVESERSGTLLAGITLITSPLKWLASLLWTMPPGSENPAVYCDVFLGGSCGNSTWRQKIAMPIMKQHGVSFFNPQLPHWDVRLMPIEREAKEHCSVLLFVVCGDTLSVASMVEAAYYIGKNRNMVLCMSDIPSQSDGEATEIEGMKLSSRAIRDYNRGRAYLASMANKAHLPIYSNVSDAVLSAVYTVKGSRVYHRSASHGALSGTSV